ncbi:hypothetical protein PALA111701_22230 [Paenibacillus lactis]
MSNNNENDTNTTKTAVIKKGAAPCSQYAPDVHVSVGCISCTRATCQLYPQPSRRGMQRRPVKRSPH